MNSSARITVWALLLSAPCLAAQEPPGSIEGIVYDSIASGVLAGAAVSVWGTDRIGVTADDGSFTIEGVEPGEHHLTFVHPRLDSLGLPPIPVPVRVESGRATRVSLAVPSGETLRRVVCGGTPRPQGVLIGRVRDERTGAAVAGAQVSAAWRREGRLDLSVADTDFAGRYTLCGLPRDAWLTLWVSRGGQRSDNERLRLGSGVLGRRDVEVDLGRAGRVIGVVVDAQTGAPLREAEIRLGEETVLSGSQGRFLLRRVERGRHPLKVSLLGYVPVDDTLTVLDGTRDMVVRMSPDPIELDPILVTALSHHLEGQGFYDRMETGTGIFMTRSEITLRNAAHTTDLLRAAPGVTVQPARDRPGYDLVLRGGCHPTYYVNGIPQIPGTFHLNDVGPHDIEALEVYSSAARVPPRFQRDSRATDPRGVVTSCSGAVVVWLR